MGLKVGDSVRWHIRPEVHKEHGGYTETEPLTGTIQSIHKAHVMVGTGKTVECFLTNGVREMRYAVDLCNPSLKRLDI